MIAIGEFPVFGKGDEGGTNFKRARPAERKIEDENGGSLRQIVRGIMGRASTMEIIFRKVNNYDRSDIYGNGVDNGRVLSFFLSLSRLRSPPRR